MRKKYKYDIAISVAEEDLGIALKISTALKTKGISYYLYTEHKASNWGRHILEISLGTYASEARYVLMLTSKVFVEKYWAGIESQISQIFTGNRQAFILQLRLDDTPVDGLSKYKVFVDWHDNADDIAQILNEKISDSHGKLIPVVKRKENRLLILLVLSFALLIGVYIYLGKVKSSSIGNFAEFTPKGYSFDSLTKNLLSTEGVTIKDTNRKMEKNAEVIHQPVVKPVVSNTQKESEVVPNDVVNTPKSEEMNTLNRINGMTYSRVRGSVDRILLSVSEKNAIQFSGSCNIYSVYGMMILKGGCLKIISGNVKGTLSLLDNADRLSGSIEIKDSPGSIQTINYRNFHD